MKSLLSAAAVIAAVCLFGPTPADAGVGDVGAAPGCAQPVPAPGVYAAPGCQQPVQPAYSAPVPTPASVQFSTPPQTYRVQGPPRQVVTEVPGDFYDVTVPGQMLTVAAPQAPCCDAAPVYTPTPVYAPTPVYVPVPGCAPAAPSVDVDVHRVRPLAALRARRAAAVLQRQQARQQQQQQYYGLEDHAQCADPDCKNCKRNRRNVTVVSAY